MSSPGSLASLDGDIMLASEATIPATDEGLIRGDGVFEVVALYDGQPFAFEEHLRGWSARRPTCACRSTSKRSRADVWRLLAHVEPGPSTRCCGSSHARRAPSAPDRAAAGRARSWPGSPR